MVVLDELLQFHDKITATLYSCSNLTKYSEAWSTSDNCDGDIVSQVPTTFWSWELINNNDHFWIKMSWETKESKAIPFIIKDESNCNHHLIQLIPSPPRLVNFSRKSKDPCPSSPSPGYIVPAKAISSTESSSIEATASEWGPRSIPAPKVCGSGPKRFGRPRAGLSL